MHVNRKIIGREGRYGLTIQLSFGGVAEWSIAAAWKAVDLSNPQVRGFKSHHLLGMAISNQFRRVVSVRNG